MKQSRTGSPSRRQPRNTLEVVCPTHRRATVEGMSLAVSGAATGTLEASSDGQEEKVLMEEVFEGWADWIWTDPTALAMAAVSTIVVYLALITYARVFGLRSFSKMSSFDFAMTIALGSLFASSISSPNPPLLLALVCLLLLFLGQKLIALARQATSLKQLVDNQPLLLMAHGETITENLRKANVTEDDLRAKLREANVLDPSHVKAVVFETTGDVSVLHGGTDEELDPALLKHVNRGPGGPNQPEIDRSLFSTESSR